MKPKTGYQLVTELIRSSGNSGGPLVNLNGELLSLHNSRFDLIRGMSIPVWEGSNLYELAGLNRFFK